MKKIFSIVVLIIMAVSSFGSDYEIFESKSIDWSQVEKRETVYIGGIREYMEKQEAISSFFTKESALNAGTGALTGLSKASDGLVTGTLSKAGQGMAAGALINVAVTSSIDLIIGAFASDIKYIRIDKITMKDGSIKRGYKMIVLSMEKKLSPEEAIEKIKG